MRKSNYFYDNRLIKEGDVFYSSWGYEQTNIDFYRVVKKVGKASVILCALENKLVEEKSNETQDAVVPYLVNTERQWKARVKYYKEDKEPRIKISSYSNAYPWNGKPLYQTNAYYGH